MQKEEEISLVFSPAMLDVVAAGLAELPYKVALPVFNAVNAQLAQKKEEQPVMENDKHPPP